MSTHSSILAWKIPWTEEPSGLHTVHGVTKHWDNWATEHTQMLETVVWIRVSPWDLVTECLFSARVAWMCPEFTATGSSPKQCYRRNWWVKNSLPCPSSGLTQKCVWGSLCAFPSGIMPRVPCQSSAHLMQPVLTSFPFLSHFPHLPTSVL